MSKEGEGGVDKTEAALSGAGPVGCSGGPAVPFFSMLSSGVEKPIAKRSTGHYVREGRMCLASALLVGNINGEQKWSYNRTRRLPVPAWWVPYCKPTLLLE